MALTQYQVNPAVTAYGSLREERYAYVGDGSATFKQGELIRINTSGQVVKAALTSGTDGAVHGMAMVDVDTATTEAIPVVMFGADTVIRMQTNTGTPADIGKGSTVTLANSGNKWAVTATTTAGIATVVDYASTGFPWSDPTGTYDYASDTTYGFVNVKFASTILESYGA